MMELEVFQRFKPQLALAICDSILGVASQCHSKGLIKDTYSEIVQLSLTTEVKAHRLLDAIEKCISTNCDHYNTFVDILNEELPDGCKKPLSEMDEGLKLMRDRHRTCSDVEMTNEGSVIDVPQSSGGSKTFYPYKRSSLKKGVSTNGKSDQNYSRTFSTDSGISLGRSDSMGSIVSESNVSLSKLNSISEECTPLKETPLPNSVNSEEIVTHEGSSKPPLGHTISDRMFNLERDLRNLRYDAKQMEAVEISLKDELEQLRGELDRAVVEKNDAQKNVRVMKSKLTKLESERNDLQRRLENQENQVDGLEEKVSTKEADIERLTAQMNECVQQISDQKAEVEQKNQTIKDLRSEIHKLERANVETVVEYQRSNSIELKAKIQQKDVELNIKDAQMIAEVKAKEEEIKATKAKVKAERICLCRVVFVLVAVLALVMSVAIGFVYFEHGGTTCGCHLKNGVVL